MKLYLVKMSGKGTGELFYKIGITNQRDAMLRFTSHGEPSQIAPLVSSMAKRQWRSWGVDLPGTSYMPVYETKLLHEVAFETNENAAVAEAELLEVVKATNGYTPRRKFKGWTECFLADADQIGIVIDIMDLHADGRSTSE